MDMLRMCGTSLHPHPLPGRARGSQPQVIKRRQAIISEGDTMAFLQIERDGAILTITMNQPETRNALTGNTAVDEFVKLCEDVRNDASVKAIILTGAGPIFSSGGNVKDMKRFFDDALTP